MCQCRTCLHYCHSWWLQSVAVRARELLAGRHGLEMHCSMRVDAPSNVALSRSCSTHSSGTTGDIVHSHWAA